MTEAVKDIVSGLNPEELAARLAPYGDPARGIRKTNPKDEDGLTQFLWRAIVTANGSEAAYPKTCYDRLDRWMWDEGVHPEARDWEGDWASYSARVARLRRELVQALRPVAEATAGVLDAEEGGLDQWGRVAAFLDERPFQPAVYPPDAPDPIDHADVELGEVGRFLVEAQGKSKVSAMIEVAFSEADDPFEDINARFKWSYVRPSKAHTGSPGFSLELSAISSDTDTFLTNERGASRSEDGRERAEAEIARRVHGVVPGAMLYRARTRGRFVMYLRFELDHINCND